jgi:hypothetical protein
LTNVSVAPGITAPLWSATEPEILPPVAAHVGSAVRRKNRTASLDLPNLMAVARGDRSAVTRANTIIPRSMHNADNDPKYEPNFLINIFLSSMK